MIDDHEIRLRCLDIASRFGNETSVLSIAQKMYQFIVNAGLSPPMTSAITPIPTKKKKNSK